MTVSERIIQDYLGKGLTMADVPKELKYRLNDKGEMKIYRYMVAHGLIKENPPEPEEKPEPKKPEPQQRPVEQPKGDNNTMNTNLVEMRNALSGYYTSAQALMAQKQKNSETYQAEVAEEQNRGIDSKLSQLYADTWKKLQDAQAAGIVQAEKWGELDGSKITDDMKLLSGAFPLAEADVVGLIEKYRDNYTMLAALDKYAAEHGFAQNRAQIRTPENRKAAWSKVHAGAITLLDTASNDVQNPVLDFAIERFGTMGYLANEIYNLL